MKLDKKTDAALIGMTRRYVRARDAAAANPYAPPGLDDAKQERNGLAIMIAEMVAIALGNEDKVKS